jgi:hypothetical protein
MHRRGRTIEQALVALAVALAAHDATSAPSASSAAAVIQKAPTRIDFPPSFGALAGSSSSAGNLWYDGSPWLSWLRPELRASAPSLAGIVHLEDLVLYDLDLKLDADNRRFALREVVYLTNEGPGPRDEWVFRLYSNIGKTVRPLPNPVLFKDGGCVDSECSVATEGAGVISVRPRTAVPSGGRIKVRFEFSGELERIDASRTDLLSQSIEGLAALDGGSAGGNYGLLAEGNGTFSLANFYAVLARRNGTRWDRTVPVPIGDLGSDDLCNVHAALDVPASLHIAHNGVLLQQEVDPRTFRRRVEIGAAMVRDFVVLAGSELTASSTTVSGVNVTSHYRSDDRIGGLQVLAVAARALSQFAQRFGPYPYVRLDLVEAPLVGGAGGVEFSGLATVASMFYAADSSNGLAALLPTGSMREFVTAHEVAHQWWHVLVGSDSRVSPFADESLTQYSAMLYFEDRYGKDRAHQEGEMNAKMTYQMMRLLGRADGRVDGPVSSFSPLSYAGLVYGKGPYFYDAVRKRIGDAAFFQALRTYVARHQFRLAPSTALVELLASGSRQQEVRALATRWLREAHGDQDLGSLALPGMAGLLGAQGKTPDVSQLMEQIMKQLGSEMAP